MLRFELFSIHTQGDAGFEGEEVELRVWERVLFWILFLASRLFVVGTLLTLALGFLGFLDRDQLEVFDAVWFGMGDYLVYFVAAVFAFGLWFHNQRLPIETRWTDLARTYLAPRDAVSVRLRGVDGQMGSLAFHNYYRLGADEAGVGLRAILPVRLGNPRLFIPWSALRLVPVEGLPIERDEPNPKSAVRLVVTTHPEVELYVTRESLDWTTVLEHAPEKVVRALAEAQPVRPAALRTFGALQNRHPSAPHARI